MSTVTPPARNLLNNRLIGGLLRSGWFPGILQIPTAAVFILIVWWVKACGKSPGASPRGPASPA